MNDRHKTPATSNNNNNNNKTQKITLFLKDKYWIYLTSHTPRTQMNVMTNETKQRHQRRHTKKDPEKKYVKSYEHPRKDT